MQHPPTFQPPTHPPALHHFARLHKGKGEDGFSLAWRAYHDALHRYNVALAEWEAATPQNVALIFDDGPGAVFAVTRDPKGGWRSTLFSRLDRMPLGHSEFPTRLEVLRDRLNMHTGPRLERMPFQVEPLRRTGGPFQP